MSIAAARPAPDLLRRVVRLQVLTIVWMSIEGIVAPVAAWTARSPALLGFGGDSAIELFSAIIVLGRFCSKPDFAVAEKLAARAACRRSPTNLKDQQPIIRLARSGLNALAARGFYEV